MLAHNLSSKAETAALLKTTSLPGSPPGANNSVFRFFAVVTSTPERLVNAFSEPLFSDKTTNIDLGVRYLLPRLLPFPARMPLPEIDLSTSSSIPRPLSKETALLVMD